jgi:hypothetical protein
VVEVKCPWIAVIAADTAHTTGLGNEQLLHPPASPRDRCGSTLLAAIVAALIEEVPPDLCQRQTLVEKLLEKSAIHALHGDTNTCSV